jgi:hypothetical protein
VSLVACFLLAVIVIYVPVTNYDRAASIETVISDGLSEQGDVGKVLGLIDLQTTLAAIGFVSFDPATITGPGAVTRVISPLEGYFWVARWLLWSQSATDDWDLADLAVNLNLSSDYLQLANDAVALNKNLDYTKRIAIKLGQSAYGASLIPEIREVTELVWDTQNDSFYDKLLAEYPARPMWTYKTDEDLALPSGEKLALARSILTDDVMFDAKADVVADITGFINAVNSWVRTEARSMSNAATWSSVLTILASLGLIAAACAVIRCARASLRFGNGPCQGLPIFVSAPMAAFAVLAVASTAYSLLTVFTVRAIHPPISVRPITDSRFEVAVMLRDHRLNINRFRQAAARFTATGDLAHLELAADVYTGTLAYVAKTIAAFEQDLVEANFRDFLLDRMAAVFDPLLAPDADAHLLNRFLLASLRLAASGSGLTDDEVGLVFPELLDAAWSLDSDDVLGHALDYGYPPYVYDLAAQLALEPADRIAAARAAVNSAYCDDLFQAHVSQLVDLSAEVRSMQAAAVTSALATLATFRTALIALSVGVAFVAITFSILLIATLIPARRNQAVPIVQRVTSSVLHRASARAYAALVAYFFLVALVSAVTARSLLVTAANRSALIDYGHKRAELAINVAFAASRLVTDPSSPTLHRELLETGFLSLVDLQHTLMYGGDVSTDTAINNLSGLVSTRLFARTVALEGSFGTPEDEANTALLIASSGPTCAALDDATFASHSASCVTAVPECGGMRQAVSGSFWPLMLAFTRAAEALADVPTADLGQALEPYRSIITLLSSVLLGVSESMDAYTARLDFQLQLISLTQLLGWGAVAATLFAILMLVLRRGINALAAEDAVICSMLARLPTAVLSLHPGLKAAVISVLLGEKDEESPDGPI